jgi:hypothetical protein
VNKYAIISTDNNPSYLFLTPITSLCWKKVGYNPIVLHIENDEEKELSCLVKEYESIFDYRIKKIKKVEGYRSCNIAQISRLFASVDPAFSEDDYLLTSDMDMLPFSSSWFSQQDWTKNIHIFDAEELAYQRHKVCYIGMNKKKWGELFNLKEKCINKQLSEFLNSSLSKNSDWDTGWNLDELYLYEHLVKNGDYLHNSQMIERGQNQYGLRNGRIDRGLWKNTLMQYISSQAIDIHLPRDSYTEQIWTDLKMLLTLVATDKEITLLEEYRKRFIDIMKGDNNEKPSL